MRNFPRPDKLLKMCEALDHLSAAQQLLREAGLTHAAEETRRVIGVAEDAVREALTPRRKPRLVK
jgi:hypothetical protein